MKAMILAAGFGTRLAPYTDHTPKPLFTLIGRPVLDLTIEQLQQSGCCEIIINCHHHHEQIENHLARQTYNIPITTRVESRILGTGGGIRNISDLWRDGPLLVINADINSNIDLAQVFRFHQQQGYPVTMVMHDHPAFNTVGVDHRDFVRSFGCAQPLTQGLRKMAFTGIHVLERRVLDFIPDQGFAGIIEAYGEMLSSGEQIKAFIATDHYWQDIGTPEGYLATAFDHMAPKAFEKAFGYVPECGLERTRLQGDGSDRSWYRVTAGTDGLILAEHGIRLKTRQQLEVDAFIDIGRHLQHKGVCVPRIYLYDRFAGMVFMQDLGDRHLQHLVHEQPGNKSIDIYQQIIDQWITMAVQGAEEFETAWTYQSTHFDRDLILEKECRYFIEAFLQGYLNWPVAYEAYTIEFEKIAEGIERYGITGLIHRDLQSRNIMVQDNGFFFIDYQGARIGPIQYDLASLLIDPYVALPLQTQAELLMFATSLLHQRFGIDPGHFKKGYAFCALSRNLQMLGAFSFLSRVKGKPAFETYIPQAITNLQHTITALAPSLPRLAALTKKLNALHIKIGQ